MWKSMLALMPCFWCAFAVFGNQVEFRGFVGQKAAPLLDGRVYSRYAREDVMDEAVLAFETHYDDTRQVIPACDFASAAPSDDWHNAFAIWFVAPLRDEEEQGMSGF